eukprot:5984052-Pleurochrysis_carterae.AAC.2
MHASPPPRQRTMRAVPAARRRSLPALPGRALSRANRASRGVRGASARLRTAQQKLSLKQFEPSAHAL